MFSDLTLTPPEVTDGMIQLEGMLKKLEASIMDAIKDVDQKRKVGLVKYIPLPHGESFHPSGFISNKNELLEIANAIVKFILYDFKV